MELRPAARGREDPAPPGRGAPGGASLPSLVAAGADHGLDEATVIQLLGALVDKSIVTVSFPSADARYDMLDTVRDYALERLAEGGGLSAAQKAHAEYYAALADAAHVQTVDRTGRPASGGSSSNTTTSGPRSHTPALHGPRHRNPIGRARLVLRARGARLRRTSLRRARARLRVRGCSGRAPTRVGGVPLLPRDGRARPRRGYRGRRTRARRDRAATAVGSRRGGALPRPRGIR